MELQQREDAIKTLIKLRCLLWRNIHIVQAFVSRYTRHQCSTLQSDSAFDSLLFSFNANFNANLEKHSGRSFMTLIDFEDKYFLHSVLCSKIKQYVFMYGYSLLKNLCMYFLLYILSASMSNSFLNAYIETFISKNVF